MRNELMEDKTILVTGGTGSFGKCFISTVLKNITLKRSLYIAEMS